MQQQAGTRRPPRPITSPKPTIRKSALLRQLLVHTALGKGDGQDITQSREGDEDTDDFLRCGAEDEFGEVGGHGGVGGGDFRGRGRGEVGDVDEDVKDRADAEAEGAGDFEGVDGVFDFV